MKQFNKEENQHAFQNILVLSKLLKCARRNPGIYLFHEIRYPWSVIYRVKVVRHPNSQRKSGYKNHINSCYFKQCH